MQFFIVPLGGAVLVVLRLQMGFFVAIYANWLVGVGDGTVLFLCLVLL